MTSGKQRARVIIITSPQRIDQPWVARLTASGEIEILECVGLVSEGVELTAQHQPEIVIIDRELAQAESAVRQVLSVSPLTLPIAVAQDLDIPVMRRLMSAGARDVLSAPVVPVELLNSIRRVLAADAERQSSHLAGKGGKGQGKLIVLVAPKGGVGTTTIAANLAIGLHRVSKREVALADFSLQFGDVGVHLNLWSKHTIADLADHAFDIDDATLSRVLCQHESGIRVLLGPNEPDAAIQITSVEVNPILDSLLTRYSYVVADTWSFLDEIAETLLRRAHEVLLVTTPELPALKSAKRFLEFAARHEIASGRISIVLSRFPSVDGISLEDVQQHLHFPISANIPSEGQLTTFSINRGIPLVISHPQSWVAQNMLKLAGRLAGDQINTIALSADEPRSTIGKERLGLRRILRRAT